MLEILHTAKAVFADGRFAVCPLPCAAHGKTFAMGFPANKASPVVGGTSDLQVDGDTVTAREFESLRPPQCTSAKKPRYNPFAVRSSSHLYY